MCRCWWALIRGHLCCPPSALRKPRPGETPVPENTLGRAPVLVPFIAEDFRGPAGRYCPPLGPFLFLVHPKPQPGLSSRVLVLRFEAGRVAGGWGGMGRQQKRPHLWACCFSSQALANGRALPVPVALRHDVGHRSLVTMSHLGSCGWVLFSSSCPLWLGRGQREHRCSPS